MRAPGVEGRLTIDVTHDAGRVTAARIASDRPVGLARAFIGKAPGDVLKTIPLLFTLCGVAHAVASVEAYEDATQQAPTPAARAARRIAVYAETAREHMLRIALDWPRFVGETPNHTPLPRVMAQVPAMRRVLSSAGDPFTVAARTPLPGDALAGAIAEFEQFAGTFIFGEPLPTWCARTSLGELPEWAEAAPTVAARFIHHIIRHGWQTVGAGKTRFLGELDQAELAATLDADAAGTFLAAPSWNRQPHETTPLARQHQAPLVQSVMQQYGPGLLARAVARLSEFANIANEMRALAAEPPEMAASRLPPGQGIAHIEAARGRLVHYLRLDRDGCVARYAILAPTEWNFHPQGVAVRALEALHVDHPQELYELADMLINVIDPCVAHELRLH